MQNYYVQIELDKDGIVDTNYYIGQAHALRSEALADFGATVAAWFKSLKAKMFAKQRFNSTRSFGTV